MPVDLLPPVGGLVARPEAEPRPLDAERILRALARHEVDYVLIGGLAVQTHGHVRSTHDADLIPAPNPMNLERLAAALLDLHARVLNPGREEEEIDAHLLPRATIWQFDTDGGAVDVVNEAPGSPPYPELRGRALVVELDELEVPVVGLDDLIRMKLARARPVDLQDVAALTDPQAQSEPP